MVRLGTTRSLLAGVLSAHLLAVAAGLAAAAGFWLYLALPERPLGEMLGITGVFFGIAALSGSSVLWWLLRPPVRDLDRALAEARVLTQKSQEQLNVLDTRITRLRKQLGDAQ
ncbi:MAG: hypothetical protein AAB289_15355 [Chloroflexota bacterium]